ncbi:hypothetical protein BGZ49_001038, partial [Haplosporangium sp. Z 27]
MTIQLYQRFRLGNTIEEVCVRTTDNNDPSSCFVNLEDIQDLLQNVQRIKIKLNGHPVPFLNGPDRKRIEPRCIGYYPDDVLDIIPIDPSQSTNTSTVVYSPTVKDLDILSFQQPLSPPSTSLQSFNSSLDASEMSKSDLALNLRAINENTHEMKKLLLEAKEKDDKILLMQNQLLDLQNQALDRLAVLQKHAEAILVQNFELHEYPIPRLFIILPVDKSNWNPTKILENKFRLHFLCECGDLTMEGGQSKDNQTHLAKHDGYEIRDGAKFFKKYGKYMLILMRALKLGIKSTKISVHHIPVSTLVGAGIDYSISYIEALSVENPVLDNYNTMDDYEGLEGADLRQLDTFLQINDQERKLGNLYRITIETGHVKWVCLEHYRSTYKERDQKAFTDVIEVNGGTYDSHLGRVVIVLGSRLRAEEFFNALAKARHIYDLDITFDWDCSTSDLGGFEKVLRMS